MRSQDSEILVFLHLGFHLDFFSYSQELITSRFFWNGTKAYIILVLDKSFDCFPPSLSVAQPVESPYKSSNFSSDVLKILKSSFKEQILRTYFLMVLVMILMVTGLVIVLYFPSVIETIRIPSKIVKLDLYFVPVFWLVFDEKVYHFTVRAIKRSFLSLVELFFFV